MEELVTKDSTQSSTCWQAMEEMARRHIVGGVFARWSSRLRFYREVTPLYLDRNILVEIESRVSQQGEQPLHQIRSTGTSPRLRVIEARSSSFPR